MSDGRLEEQEKEKLKNILEDLKIIFEKDYIPADEIDDLLQALKSEEVKHYINSLIKGSKKETALRESFFAGQSVLSKYLFREIIPEESTSNGFIDYSLKLGEERNVRIELKSLFELDSKGLKQRSLDWTEHKKQIMKYISEEARFVILINLKDWFFFSSNYCTSIETCKPFYNVDLFKFQTEFDKIGDLWGYLEREESLFIGEDLDKKFFNDLKRWVGYLDKLKFNVDDKKKKQLIIYLINKFIFVKTLDDYGVVDFRWIQKTWDFYESRWIRKGYKAVVSEFFKELDSWFYNFYDTELFKESILQYIEDNEKNFEQFYKKLKYVLGLEDWMSYLGGMRGIIQYNFKKIDEDILGKAYETYLAEIRKEQGIYYTPKYVTKYIVKNTVGVTFDGLLNKIKRSIEKEDFDGLNKHINQFLSTKVLDPACGSGSFLIKAIRLIWRKYQILNNILSDLNTNTKNKQTNSSSFSDYEEDQRIIKLKELVSLEDNRELISKMILRHIHGNDLDIKALDVAKVNVWLEAIKLSPKDFKESNVPKDTNHILPNLELNFENGDSLVGLPDDFTVDYLHRNHKEGIINMFKLRKKYLEKPSELDHVNEITLIKEKLRNELDNEFKKYLEENELPKEISQETIPFHWVLEFWYCFFDENGEILDKEKQGFEDVIGNPPWVDYRLINPPEVHELFKKVYYSAIENKEKYNLYVIFIERGINLLIKNGKFGYINPLQVMSSLMAFNLRKYLLSNFVIREIVDLSSFSIFEGVTLTNVGLFFIDKTTSKEKYKIKISYKTKKQEIEQKKVISKELDKEVFVYGDDLVFLLDCRDSIVNTIQKINTNLRLYKKVELKWGTSQSGYGKKLIPYEEYNKLDKEKKPNFGIFIQTGDIERYSINWQGRYIKKSVYSEKQIEAFKKTKIVISRRSPVLESAFDYEGKYFLGKVAFTSRIDKNINPYFLLGVLNSKICDFYFKKVYESLHPGGNIRYDIPYLYQLPIKFSEDKNIKNLVKKITQYKHVNFRFGLSYLIWSTKLKNTEYSLSQILITDLNKIRSGEENGKWTTNSSIYPEDENELLEKEFKSFIVRIDNKKLIVEIYGLDENRNQEKILELEFINKDLLEIIYISLLNLLGSRFKVKTLKEIFDKTLIPVIVPKGYSHITKKSMDSRLKDDEQLANSVIKLTPNILKKVKEEVKKWSKEEKIEYKEELSLPYINKQIEDIDGKIDAEVFKLYKLTEKEVKTVLDTLKINKFYQDKVFGYLED